MPPFLPIQALNRSQAVRIGGKHILPKITSYVDFGQLAIPYSAPSFTYSKVGKKAEGPGLKKSVYFPYAVTAVDAAGGETQVSVLAVAKTEAGAETESNLNFVKLTWEPVTNATKYNIYRGGKAATGIASEALAQVATLGLIGNSTTASFTDFGAVETPGVEPPTVNGSSFNTNKNPGWSPFKELQNHTSQGAIIVVGGLTNSSSDWVISSGGTLSGIETKLKITLGEATWKQRSTGRVAVTKSTQLTVTAAASGKFAGIYFVFNAASGTLEIVAGAEVAEAKLVVYPTLKATQIPFASGLVGEAELEVATPPTAIAPGLVDLRNALRA